MFVKNSVAETKSPYIEIRFMQELLSAAKYAKEDDLPEIIRNTAKQFSNSVNNTMQRDCVARTW